MSTQYYGGGGYGLPQSYANTYTAQDAHFQVGGWYCKLEWELKIGLYCMFYISDIRPDIRFYFHSDKLMEQIYKFQINSFIEHFVGKPQKKYVEN